MDIKLTLNDSQLGALLYALAEGISNAQYDGRDKVVSHLEAIYLVVDYQSKNQPTKKGSK